MPKKAQYHQTFVRLKSLTTSEWLVHPDLRQHMIDDAASRGTNLAEVAMFILADRYKVPHDNTGRRTVPKEDGDFLSMRLPVHLWRAVRAAALKAGRRDLDEIRFVLCTYYGLAMPAKGDQ